MSAIKDGRMPIELDRQRHMLFSLNVMDEVEDRIGSVENLSDVMNGPGRLKVVKWLFTLLLNEGALEGEEMLTEKQVGKMIHGGNLSEITKAIYQAFAYGNRGTVEPLESDETEDEDDEDGEEGKNAVAGKAK